MTATTKRQKLLETLLYACGCEKPLCRVMGLQICRPNNSKRSIIAIDEFIKALLLP